MTKLQTKHDNEDGQSEAAEKNDPFIAAAERVVTVASGQTAVYQGANVEELIHSCYDQVCKLASRLTFGDDEETKDLIQESFYRALSSFDSFKGQSCFSTWMYRIVVNTWSSKMRRRRIWRSISAPVKKIKGGYPEKTSPEDYPDADKAAQPAAACENKRFKAALQQALQYLPQKQQLVFTLKVQQEMSIAEIVTVTGLAEGTVKTHLFRATKRLRKSLKDWIEI